MRIMYIGHAGFFIEINGANILIDPYITNKTPKGFVRRISTPKIKLPHINAVFITHEHFDHFDEGYLHELIKYDNPHIIVPEGLCEKLNYRKCIEVSVGEEINVSKLNVNVVPAKHPQSKYPVGYIIEGLYHAGDTYLYNEMNMNACNVALLPIGGTYTMDEVAAATAVRYIKPKHVIPMHYNTFDQIKANVQRFKESAKKYADVHILEPGDEIEV